MVSDNAVVPDPAVAVIVTVPLPAGVPGFEGGGAELPSPPQLVIPHVTIRSAINTPQYNRRRIDFFFRKSAHNANEDPPPINGQGLLLCAEVGAVVVIESVVVTLLPLGVRLEGEKVQADSLGNPEQANETC